MVKEMSKVVSLLRIKNLLWKFLSIKSKSLNPTFLEDLTSKSKTANRFIFRYALKAMRDRYRNPPHVVSTVRGIAPPSARVSSRNRNLRLRRGPRSGVLSSGLPGRPSIIALWSFLALAKTSSSLHRYPPNTCSSTGMFYRLTLRDCNSEFIRTWIL